MIGNISLMANIAMIIAAISIIVSNKKSNPEDEYIVRITPEVALNSEVFIRSLLYIDESMEAEKMLDLVDKYISHKLGVKLFKNELVVLVNSVKYEHRKHLQVRDGLKRTIQSNKDLLEELKRTEQQEKEEDSQNNINRSVRYE